MKNLHVLWIHKTESLCIENLFAELLFLSFIFQIKVCFVLFYFKDFNISWWPPTLSCRAIAGKLIEYTSEREIFLYWLKALTTSFSHCVTSARKITWNSSEVELFVVLWPFDRWGELTPFWAGRVKVDKLLKRCPYTQWRVQAWWSGQSSSQAA